MASDKSRALWEAALARLSARLIVATSVLWPLTGVVLGLFIGGLMLGSKTAPIERNYLDIVMTQRKVRELDGPGSPIALVTYDNSDARLYGKDVDRAVLDRLVRKLLASDPKALVLDFQFSEEDRPAVSVSKALSELQEQAPGTPPEVLEALRSKYDATAALLETLGDPRVVGAFFSRGVATDKSLVPADLPLPPESQLLLDAQGCENFYAPAVEVLLDHPQFLERLPNYGNVRLETDSDGIVRRYNLFTRIGPTVYPSLALVGAALGHDDPVVFIECDGTRVKAFSIGTANPDRFDLSQSPDAGFLVDYGGKFEQSFPNHVTFREVLEGGEEIAKRFAGRVVFLGLENPYQDKYPTLHDPIFPGVAIHATVAHDLLTGHQLRRHDVKHEIYAEPLACVGVGLLVTLMFFFIGRSWVLALSPVFALAGHFGTVELLQHGYLVNLLAPGLVGAVGILACGAMRLVIDQRIADRAKRLAEQEALRADQERLRAEEQRLRAERLGAFLSPDVAKIAGENPELLRPARQEISILFSDIRGFTTTAEGMPPEHLAEMLSEYLTWMTEIVLANRGTLDKYIGDAVMAIFGAPLAEKAHAKWACATALEMMEALDGLNERWAEQGKKPLRIGIGINTGPVVVGTMGSQKKPEYTCIGDEVNFASRAEGLTKAYGATIIVGESTRLQAGDDFVFRELGPVKVKGKTKGVKIYELLGTRAALGETAWVDAFHQGLNAFLLRDWNKAEELFGRVSDIRGAEDGPAKAFVAWTQTFREHPPAEGWDGSLERREK